MNLSLPYNEFVSIISGNIEKKSDCTINGVYYDSRLIHSGKNGVFFALKSRRDGHSFLKNAYQKGVRVFVVEHAVNLPDDALVIQVKNTLKALQKLAKYNRSRYSYPVLAITGNLGKTTIKEWLYSLLCEEYSIVRSPKSFNSQIGVALSLLELDDSCNLAIIEADISHPNEMDTIEDMVMPTLGIYTGIGHYYAANFPSQEEHELEHLKLFQNANLTFILPRHKSVLRRNKITNDVVQEKEWEKVNFSATTYPGNLKLVLHVAHFLGLSKEYLIKKSGQLPTLSNRMEVFEGIDNNLIINDSYNIDIDALEQALSYQFSSDEREDKIVVLDFAYVDEKRKKALLSLVKSYNPKNLFIIENGQVPKELMECKNSSILFKGSYRSRLKEVVLLFKNRKHETWVEFDLKSIQHNIRTFQSKLPLHTKILIMVKASSYGTGDINIPHFLQQIGIDYLGVAYTDEGATLRENQITLPILVMNTEINAFDDLIRYNLEPSIVSFRQLEMLCQKLKAEKITNFPVHITVETGMNRLGFNRNDIPQLIEMLKHQKEVTVKSVYSHLADADNPDESYTFRQIRYFKTIKQQFEASFDGSILFHILNSEGASKFAKEASFDMVRLGIGMYGYTSSSKEDELLPTLKWKTTISQIKLIQEGETVGYKRKYKAVRETKIATIRLGYADGFRRSFSNGVGSVIINDVECRVIGNVCMDMTMIDVSTVICQAGDEVEIIGQRITMEEFAKRLNTIPYEVMTSINKRVSRIYLK